jgi:hypothetical protein
MLKFVFTVLLIVLPSSLYAQALDIDGVEIYVGQDISEAIKKLSIYENKKYADTATPGFFTYTILIPTYKNPYNINVFFYVNNNNKIDSISKFYVLNLNSNVALVYAKASSEIRRRGGNVCVYEDIRMVPESELSSYTHAENKIYIKSIKKKCGAYSLDFTLPTKRSDGSIYSGEIHIMLR